MKKKLNIKLKEKKYPIFIGDNILHKTGELLSNKLKNTERIFIISDTNVYPLYGKVVESSLKNAGYIVNSGIIKAGETSKKLETASHFYDKLIEHKMERDSAIISLGGGVVGDLAGFVAATYMRGINFVQIPTSLLAQVDSSIGGKVAVNHPRGKNLIGDFHQPALVITDISTLDTLEKNEFISGMGEVIKHGFGFNRDYFNYLNTNSSEILDLNREILVNLIYGSCQIKKKIVEQDEKEEKGIRAKLNLGHTIGHALENVTNYEKYNHGQAVAVGLVYETALSARLSFATPDITKKIIKCLKSFSLPTSIPENIESSSIINALKYDKKTKKGRVRFSLPSEIGRTIITDNWSEKELEDILN